jgi:hypothetical protein
MRNRAPQTPEKAPISTLIAAVNNPLVTPQKFAKLFPNAIKALQASNSPSSENLLSAHTPQSTRLPSHRKLLSDQHTLSRGQLLFAPGEFSEELEYRDENEAEM